MPALRAYLKRWDKFQNNGQKKCFRRKLLPDVLNRRCRSARRNLSEGFAYPNPVYQCISTPARSAVLACMRIVNCLPVDFCSAKATSVQDVSYTDVKARRAKLDWGSLKM